MRMKKIVGIFLAAMTMLSACKKGGTQLENKSVTESDKSIKSVEAVIPNPVSEGTDVNKFINGDDHWKWWEDYIEKVHNSQTVQEGMGQYYEQIQKELLSDASDHNAVCSPLNIYIALSMLAEVTDGNTRKQILDVLNVKDMDVLNKRIEAIWDANYVDTPALKSMLANSIWLKSGIGYNEDTLKRLSTEYHASSYSGEMGSKSMNLKLQKWTDEHTGGLLKEYTKELELKPESVLALISTVYYKASWDKEFPKEQTNDGIFHGLSGDKSVPMMNNDVMTNLYQTELLVAICEECYLRWEYDNYILYPYNCRNERFKYIVTNERNKKLAQAVAKGIISTEQQLELNGKKIPFFWGWNIHFTYDDKEYVWWYNGQITNNDGKDCTKEILKIFE